MIEIDDVLAHAMLPLLDARVILYQHFLELDRRGKRAASDDDLCMRMMTVPGVGSIAALTFKAAVDDPARFKRSRTVGPGAARSSTSASLSRIDIAPLNRSRPMRFIVAWRDRRMDRVALRCVSNSFLGTPRGWINRLRQIVSWETCLPSSSGCSRMSQPAIYCGDHLQVILADIARQRQALPANLQVLGNGHAAKRLHPMALHGKAWRRHCA